MTASEASKALAAALKRDQEAHERRMQAVRDRREAITAVRGPDGVYRIG